ncbi:M14 family metallopeptidase [Pelomonas sp. KK5]|uniref:M14 family metallopeptidase n=1 Tax=Pelomonas sp. KK5 TaxID=1855730 RepID=UPI00097C14C2|nr:M14 family metallopeptidase [Pelomonas sp. KK5]
MTNEQPYSLDAHGFAPRYTDARHAWLRAATARGAQIDSQRHPGTGPDGEALWMDAARFGDPAASSLLVITCGTHGIEGYAGSAVLTAWLDGQAPDPLPAGTALLLIHAVNPWGFAHWQRGTENNVDLNRNFLPYPALPAPNQGYAELHPQLMLADWNEAEIARAFAAMDAFRAREGEKAFSDAFNGGQYLEPDGVFYGGRQAECSNLALRQLLARHLGGARRCLLVDLHTGIGPYGQPFIINVDPPGSFGRERARQVWGDEALSGKGSTHAALASYQGLMIDAFAGAEAACEVSAVAVEFGTLERRRMQRAHLASAWMRRQQQDSEALRRARAEYREAFIPSDPAWRSSVIREGTALCRRAREALVADAGA